MRFSMTRLPLAMLLATTLGACGDDAGTNDTADTADTSGGDTADTSDTNTGDADTSDVTITGEVEGTWAMLEVQTALVTTELLGTTTQTSKSYYLASLADGKMTVTLCDWATDDETGLTATRMGNKVLASLGPFERSYTTSEVSGAWKLSVDNGIALRGVELANPATDAMPTVDTDATVRDQDTDNHPGITLVVTGTIAGELYVAHRHQAALAGTLASDTHISGLTAWTTEQVIFGSQPALLANQKPVAVTHPDASKSHFEMFKVEAGADCAAINAARATLFADE